MVIKKTTIVVYVLSLLFIWGGALFILLNFCCQEIFGFLFIFCTTYWNLSAMENLFIRICIIWLINIWNWSHWELINLICISGVWCCLETFVFVFKRTDSSLKFEPIQGWLIRFFGLILWHEGVACISFGISSMAEDNDVVWFGVFLFLSLIKQLQIIINFV